MIAKNLPIRLLVIVQLLSSGGARDAWPLINKKRNLLDSPEFATDWIDSDQWYFSLMPDSLDFCRELPIE